MAACKTKPFIEALRIDAGVMRQQLDHHATSLARFRDRPLHQPLANAAAATMRCDADVLEQAAAAALGADASQHRELQAADDSFFPVDGDDELQIGIAFDPLECLIIALRQRILDPLAGTAERIIRQHADDGGNILAARATNRDR